MEYHCLEDPSSPANSIEIQETRRVICLFAMDELEAGKGKRNGGLFNLLS